jgi:hypothetical protein
MQRRLPVFANSQDSPGVQFFAKLYLNDPESERRRRMPNLKGERK